MMSYTDRKRFKLAEMKDFGNMKIFSPNLWFVYEFLILCFDAHVRLHVGTEVMYDWLI